MILTIQRSCSYQIITRAVQSDGQPLVAMLRPGAENCDFDEAYEQLQAGLDANPEAIVVYNQHADAIALVDSLDTPTTQIFIEIRQDTRGVLGLHAIRHRLEIPETLELIYQ